MKEKIMTITELRKNIYFIFDEIARTGKRIEIDRHGTKIIITAEKPISKIEKLKQKRTKKAYVGNSEEIITMNWETEWAEKHI